MKVGDKVRITKKPNGTIEPFVPLDYRGSEGVIVANEKNESCYKQQSYWVCIKNVIGDRWFCEDELEVIK